MKIVVRRSARYSGNFNHDDLHDWPATALDAGTARGVRIARQPAGS
ncbi:hypothetical protein [Haloactinopolyspora sp.]|nr:hypothetical protein [Haloactinopolyspora sp.]